MPERLDSDEIHLWIAALDLPAQRFEPILDPEERRQADRLATDVLRRRFVVRRGLRRAVLALYAADPPSRLRFTREDRGKPRLFGSDVSFSCTSSGDIALIAVARRRRVGVDVERLRRVERAVEIASSVFAPEEQGLVQASGGLRRDVVFLQAWTRMEASLKARGLDLATALRAPSASWAGRRVQSLGPVPGHVGAVAAEGPDWRISWRSW